ncbi:MAG: D-alanine--D-alanine ligase [Candidatus Omnitrophica bacterium]|nr:D-alanine--D-alanine ligase [Candidatus Omnitrophota bacterium]
MKQGFFSNRKLKLSKNLSVGVLSGGDSSESQISKRSGRAVYQALKRAGYEADLLDPAKFRDGLTRVIRKFDVAFVALHGRGGEDGQIQRILGRAKIPYVGSDPLGCKYSFDKKISKKIFKRYGIPTPKYRILSKGESWERLRKFPVPFFVKPTCEGSSIGAFPVEDLAKSAEKIKRAQRLFGELLIEEKIAGRELTVGVLGQKALPVIEVRPKRGFYDYKAKYTKGMTEYLVPAPISRCLAQKLQKIALKTHRLLRLRHLSRIDFMVDGKGLVYVLEANAIPGFTELSLLPKAAKLSGLSFEKLCCTLVEWAHEKRNG